MGPRRRRPRERPPRRPRRRVAQGRGVRELARGSGAHGHRRPPHDRAQPAPWAVRGARQSLSPSGRSARRGDDRRRRAAVPVARLRLRPHHRPAAAPLHRCADRLRSGGTRRRHLRRATGPRRTPTFRFRRHGRDTRRVGRDARVRHGRPLQPGLRRRHAARRAARRTDLRRHPPRGRSRLCGVGLRQAHRATGSVLRHRGTGLDQPAHRPLRRQGRRGAGARHQRPGALEGAGARRLPRPRPDGRVRRRVRLESHRARRLRSRRADVARREARARQPGRDPPRPAR